MFNNEKNILEKYRQKRKDKISVFGRSIEFDWMILVFFTLISITGVFYWFYDTFNRIQKFVPESQEEDSFLLEDKRINLKIDKVLSGLGGSNKTEESSQ
jgi:hypothetical protein